MSRTQGILGYLCLLIIWIISQLAFANDAHAGWRSEFDGGDLNGADAPVFIDGRTREPAPDRLIFRSQGGVVALGGRFEEAGDYAELTWPQLRDLSLQVDPILEMRCRLPKSDTDVYVEVRPTFLTADGSQKTISLYTSGQPDQWRTTAFRLAGNEPLPDTWRPDSLVGLAIRVHGKRTAEVEIDWVRLRERNDGEQRREEEWRSLVKGGPPTEPAVLREFFPFGVYDEIADISRYPISHRHSFDVMSRNHLNYKQAAFTGPNIRAAEQTGIRISVRVRPMLNRFTEGGVEVARDWVRPYVDAVGDSSAVIGYDIGDERPLADLWPAAASVRILEQIDPTRFSSLCFFDPTHIPAYEPFLCLYLCDIYPLGRGRTAEYPYEWCQSVAKQTANKRHWMILQTFGDTPYRRSGAHGGWILPNAAELRLMTFGSIAGGARGFIHYGFNWDGADTLLDQWCNPQGDLVYEVSRLGELLIPIGKRLLDAEVDFETVVSSDNEDGLIVGVLRAPDRGVHYLVVVNKNVRGPESGVLRLPLDWRDRTILDMASLTESSGDLRISLRPGDGKIFMIGSALQTHAEADAVRGNRIEESLRAMTPDLSTAKSWNMDVSEVLDLQRRALDVDGQTGRLDARETSARKAGETLKALLAAEPYASIRAQLDQIGRRMGPLQPAMYHDLRDATTAKIMTPLRDPYWQLHASWADAYSMLLEGRREGLQSRVAELVAESERLLADAEKALAGDLFYVTNPTSLQKVLPKKGPAGPPAERLRIAMCRGEFEPVQIVVHAGEKMVEGVRVSATGLTGPDSAELLSDRLEVNPMGFVQIESPTRGSTKLLGSKGGSVPDVLLPDRAMDVPAGSRQPYYITVRTLADDAPGEYHGQVQVSAKGRMPILIPVVVRVYDVALPTKPHLNTAFGLCAGYRKIEGADPGADLETLLRYSKFMLKHRISPRIYGGDYERTKVPPRRLEDGTWDFSGTDKFLSELVPLGLTTFYTHAGAGIPAYANHLKEKGWYDLAHVYMYDEAPISQLPTLADQYKLLSAAVPGVKILQVGWSPTKPLEDFVNMWCPLISHADLDGLRRVRERGGEAWWYTWDGPWRPYPNICHIDEPGIHARITGWMTYDYQIQGFLYWSIDIWDTNRNRPPGGRLSVDEYDRANYSVWKANTYGKTSYGHPRNGDGYLIYPGKGNVPLASLRLAHTRDGFEDYDLFKEVEYLAKGDSEAATRARELLEFSNPMDNPVIVSRTKWTKADNHLLRRREEILKVGEALRRPDDAYLRRLRDEQTMQADNLYPDEERKAKEKDRAFGATPPEKARYVDGADYDALKPKLTTVAALPEEGWLFKPDSDAAGVKSEYFNASFPTNEMVSIRIGDFWDTQGHSELSQGWYRLSYECPTIPGAEQGKRVYLRFAAVDESAWVYIDGELVGWYDTVYPSRTWTSPFLIDVTGSLRSGENHLLVIRVGNDRGAGGIYKPVTLMVEK